MKNISLDTLKWEGNSKLIFELIIKSTPILMRSSMKKKLLKWFKENNISSVNEPAVLKALQASSSWSFQYKISTEIEKLRTED